MSACAALGDKNVSTAITNFAPAIPRRARSASATSLNGSAPNKMRQSTFPFAANSRIAAVSTPLRGARPSDSAPRTLPRRKTGNTVVCGALAITASTAAMVFAADSAKFPRPATTVIAPADNCAATSDSESNAARVAAVVPGSVRTERHAYFVRPVSCDDTSMIRIFFFCTASRKRKYRTGISSLRSGARRMTVFEAHAESMVAWG